MSAFVSCPSSETNPVCLPFFLWLIWASTSPDMAVYDSCSIVLSRPLNEEIEPPFKMLGYPLIKLLKVSPLHGNLGKYVLLCSVFRYCICSIAVLYHALLWCLNLKTEEVVQILLWFPKAMHSRTVCFCSQCSLQVFLLLFYVLPPVWSHASVDGILFKPDQLTDSVGHTTAQVPVLAPVGKECEHATRAVWRKRNAITRESCHQTLPVLSYGLSSPVRHFLLPGMLSVFLGLLFSSFL